MDDYSGGISIRSSRGGGGGGGTGTKCGRWNPTSEQVKVLTELFRSGLRTPSTDQIQKISSQLSYYGKIESKNVFYWFQNHKARERQKRRRVLVDDGNDIFHTTPHDNSTTTKVSSTKYFSEIRQVSEPAERVLETLQLFPINSFSDPGTEKFNLYRNNYKGNSTSFTYNITNTEMDNHHYHHHHHPKLDLQLSFV